MMMELFLSLPEPSASDKGRSRRVFILLETSLHLHPRSLWPITRPEKLARRCIGDMVPPFGRNING